MRWFVHVYQYYMVQTKIIETLADGDGFPYFSSSASNDDYAMMMILFSIALCASLYASECTRVHLRTPKIIVVIVTVITS